MKFILRCFDSLRPLSMTFSNFDGGEGLRIAGLCVRTTKERYSLHVTATGVYRRLQDALAARREKLRAEEAEIA